MWDAIVCTCQNRESAKAVFKELKIRQKLGSIEKGTLLLTVEDPKPNIGSGSATLNALLCVAERLAAERGQTTLDPQSISNYRILILLLGSTFPFSSCGHAFLPDAEVVSPDDTFEHNTLYTNMDHLVDNLRHLIPKDSPNGVWVCSTDMVLDVAGNPEPLDISKVVDNGIGVVTVKAEPEHAGKHGACKLNSEGEFDSIHYGAGTEGVKAMVDEDGRVNLIAGIAYFSPAVAALFVSFYIIPPLDACTYIALDSGAKPVSVSLFFDILMCLTKDMSASDFEAGRYARTTSVSHSSQDDPLLRKIRASLWLHLVQKHRIKMNAIPLKDSKHLYLRYIAGDILQRYKHGQWLTSEGTIVINSQFPPDTVVGSGSVLIGCDVIQHYVHVGKDCFLSGISDTLLPTSDTATTQKLVIPDKIALQEVLISVGLGKAIHHLSALIVYGVEDDLSLHLSSPELTFCNEKWRLFLKRTGIFAEELWPYGTPEQEKTLMTARLFPISHPDEMLGANEILWLAGVISDSPNVFHRRWQTSWRMSMKEILSCVDYEAELERIRRISFEKQKAKMMDVLVNGKDAYLKPLFKTSIIQGFQDQLLASLDEVVGLIHEKYALEDTSKRRAIFPAVCRVYSCIADVLSFMAGKEGGIRAGPASNAAWRKAFAYLDACAATYDVVPATKALAMERSRWTNNGPDLLLRAARHYERASQKLILVMVDTVTKFITLKSASLPDIGQEVVVTAPARVDIAGAWCDTPPQAYEKGGKVCTVATKLKGKRPIKVITKRIAEFKVKVTWGDGWENEFTQLSDFSDYSQPSASAALLKCAFICAGIVEYPSNEPLHSQLKRKFGSGFEVSSVADIPLGSGLGTSSILGGCILAGLFRASGNLCDLDSLVHATLKIEQMLTTGGGWQDQCGGLFPGIKLSESPKDCTQLFVSTKCLKIPDGFLEKFTKHFHLVYTGKTRLARNVLQDVLRRWHSRQKEVIHTVVNLARNAEIAAEGFETGDLAKIGGCLKRGQEYKVIMAPDSLPPSVSVLIDKIQDYVYGCSLTGAGGGGFLAIVAKEEGFGDKLASIFKEISGHFEVYPTEVDLEGMVINI